MKKGQKLLFPFFVFDKGECGCSIRYYPKSGCEIRNFCEEHGKI